ncbi:MAG TPA: sigma-70 family RNA polymerase sigma factor [Steroidobacteraceae bacterium]|jgi:RNA polymerase sigma-70 factor (ECF subfamily)
MQIQFEQLVREHGGRIRRIARRYAPTGSVDDLVQDILVRLWRSLRSFRGEARIETWIYRVALNAAMTSMKDLIRERELRTSLSEKSVTEHIAAPGGSEAEVLESFMAGLGEIDASVLMMYLDGLTAAEMSSVLGISDNAISVRINRLKQKFSDNYVE